MGRPCSLLTFSRKGALSTLPCETDQAKPDRISRLARSTNLSKILEGDSPERDPLDRGPDRGPDCPRTGCATLLFSVEQQVTAFWRELFKVIKATSSGQALFPPDSGLPTQSRCAKNQRSSRAKRARATKARGRTSSRVMQWLVLSREFPTGANGGALDRPQLTQRTSSITLASHFPQTGQARKLCSGPPGGSTTHLQLD